MERIVKRAIAALLIVLPTLAQAKDVYLSMLYSNAMEKSLPFDIFTKGEWTPDPNARFVKLHMYLDEPVLVQGIEINSCGTLKKDDISIFFNFDQWLLSLSPELRGEIPQAMTARRMGELLVLGGFKKSVEVRSLTFNFEHNRGFKICGIRLLGPLNKPYTVKVPSFVQGRVNADSILEPSSAYNPLYLFDSRFEYGWASNKQETGVSLSLDFEQEQHIEKLRFWGGYQRSVSHYLANSRPSRIHLSGDGGYDETITVRDQLGSQLLTLPKPFDGKHLQLTVDEAVVGGRYKDLVVSELRFYDGNGWFMVDPWEQLHASISENRRQFAEAGAHPLLNDSYIASSSINEDYSVETTLRLRADGSFYLSGYLNDDSYFALGNYEIKSASIKDGLVLRLFGLYYEYEAYGDCNGCGRDCNKSALPEPDPDQKIFQEFITLKPMGGGTFALSNMSGGKIMKFHKLLFHREQ